MPLPESLVECPACRKKVRGYVWNEKAIDIRPHSRATVSSQTCDVSGGLYLDNHGWRMSWDTGEVPLSPWIVEREAEFCARSWLDRIPTFGKHFKCAHGVVNGFVCNSCIAENHMDNAYKLTARDIDVLRESLDATDEPL